MHMNNIVSVEIEPINYKVEHSNTIWLQQKFMVRKQVCNFLTIVNKHMLLWLTCYFFLSSYSLHN
jgi:hypothetical protein